MTTPWAITLFVAHAIALIGAAALYRRAPCWMQKLAMFGIGVAMLMATIAYFIAVMESAFPELGWWGSWPVFLIALLIEHIAVLLWIFRIIWNGGALLSKPLTVPRSTEGRHVGNH